MAELAGRLQCGGLILHSAMLSGIRVLDPDPDGLCKPSMMFGCFDIFRNYDHVRRPSSGDHPRVLLIHGQRDNVVLFHHSQVLYKLVPEARRYENAKNVLVEWFRRAASIS